MGKYSGIDAKGLKQAAITALDEINNHALNRAFDTINKDKYLNTSSEKNITKALDDIMHSHEINGSIVKLKGELNKIISISDSIVSYEEADTEIKRLEPNLYREYTYEVEEQVYHMYSPKLDKNGNQVYDYSGRPIEQYDPHYETVTRYVTETGIDPSVQNRINTLKNNMTAYERNIQANL